MILALIMGCTTSLLGDWSGECIFYDGRTEESMSIDASINRDNGYILEGKMKIVDWNEEEFNGDLSGDHTGKYVLIKSDFESEEGTYRLRVETERLGNTLEGTCTIKSPEAPGGLVGDVTLAN